MHSEQDLHKLLKAISDIQKENELLQQEKKRRGEQYCVFDTICFSSSLEKQNSAFIAHLLNPKANHGCGDLFLRTFFSAIPELGSYPFESPTPSCKTEHYIGPKEENTGGYIDILIGDKKFALIIENKIYASDQKNQLIRYDNYGKASAQNYKLLYLTLSGDEASNYSAGELDSYIRISYASDILNWLNECVRLTYNKPLIRETLNQYINYIKRLTYQNMEQENINKSIQIATDYLDAVAYIIQNESKISLAIRQKYIFEPLEEKAKELGLIFEKVWDKTKSPSLTFKRAAWNGHIIVSADSDKNKDLGKWVYLWIGIEATKEPNANKLDCLEEHNKYYPYGYEYLDVSDWHSASNFVAMKEAVAKEIIAKIKLILEELDSKNIVL